MQEEQRTQTHREWTWSWSKDGWGFPWQMKGDIHFMKWETAEAWSYQKKACSQSPTRNPEWLRPGVNQKKRHGAGRDHHSLGER